MMHLDQHHASTCCSRQCVQYFDRISCSFRRFSGLVARLFRAASGLTYLPIRLYLGNQEVYSYRIELLVPFLSLPTL